LTVYTALVQCTDIAADQSAAISVHCTKAVYTIKKCSREWMSLLPETCRADLKRSINGICCILLVAYIIVLMTHGLTNIKFKQRNIPEEQRPEVTHSLAV